MAKGPDEEFYRNERELPHHHELDATMIALRAQGEVADRDFDRIFPKEVQKLGRTHWTPVDVARRVAHWLAPKGGGKILDVGAGAGKFCLVGALTTSARFTGIERNPSLARVARDLAKKYKIQNTKFITGDALDVDWTPFSGLYLFNPFAQDPGGAGVEQQRYLHQVELTEAKLALLPSGTRVAVFFGYGGATPAGFQVIAQERSGSGMLEFWQRR